jgi:hypothetical protein
MSYCYRSWRNLSQGDGITRATALFHTSAASLPYYTGGGGHEKIHAVFARTDCKATETPRGYGLGPPTVNASWAEPGLEKGVLEA